jgi:hypothetical protein
MIPNVGKELRKIALGVACVFAGAASIGVLALEGYKNQEKQKTPECVALRQNMDQVFNQAVALQKGTGAPIDYVTVVSRPDKDGRICSYSQSTR